MSLLTNLLSYYKLDIDGTDSVGSNDASSVSVTSGGIINSCNTGKFTIPVNTIPSGTTAGSINFWFKIINTSGDCYISYSGNDVFAYNVEFDAGNGRITTSVYINGGWASLTSLQYQTPAINTWHMITLTWDSTGIYYYYDKTFVDSDSRQPDINQGSTLWEFDRSDRVNIDEVGIWSKRITTDEIIQLYNYGNALSYDLFQYSVAAEASTVVTDSVICLNAIRDVLRDELTDPYTLISGKPRNSDTWIWANEPHSTFKYPQIEIVKMDNPSIVLTIGSDYWEEEHIIANIWFYSKNGFKATIDGVEYSNAQLVEKYLGQIKQTLKANFSTLVCAGAKGYKHLNTTKIEYDKETQLYYGACTVHVRFFTQ